MRDEWAGPGTTTKFTVLTVPNLQLQLITIVSAHLAHFRLDVQASVEPLKVPFTGIPYM